MDTKKFDNQGTRVVAHRGLSGLERENTASAFVAAGKKLKLEISEFKETRSTAQNAWYWLFCSAVAKFLDDAGLTYGEYALPYTGELIHGIHKKVLGLKTTTNLSKDAFSEMCLRLEVFWSEKTGGEFIMPEPPVQYLAMKGYEEL